MKRVSSELVHIVRDFLIAHRMVRGVLGRFRAGTLRFEDVQSLVGDSEASVLFRIKERCHALFRAPEFGSDERVRREALFDLAVGSLFHEAMKFRENFYQLEIYAPRVRSVREATEGGGATGDIDDEARELFDEFEKILAVADSRLAEAVNETEALLGQTSRQFRLLLTGHPNNGLVARYLIEEQTAVDEVFEDGLESLLVDIYGTSAKGYLVAAESYLQSAFFEEARSALRVASSQLADRPDLERLACYADGMQAFHEARYEESLQYLGDWLNREPGASEMRYAPLVHGAVSSVSRLVEGKAGERLAARADELVQQLEPLLTVGSPTVS